MAILFNVAASGSATATSLTYSHTCGGTDRILFVAVFTDTADNVDNVTGITYNTVAMTRVDSFRSPGLGGHVMYMLVNPASGANNVVVSSAASVTIYASSASYTGALQTGQPDANNGAATDPATSQLVNVTTVLDNCRLVSSAGRKQGSGVTISASTGVTDRNINTAIAIGDSNDSKSPPGSFGQTWAISGSSGISVISISVSPAPEVGNYAYFM